MSADNSIKLTLDNLKMASVHDLRAALRAWMILEDPTCLMHPHGFYVILLKRTETEEWRFHFWPQGPRTFVGMPATIHTHDCHVQSLILQGELVNTTYDVIDVPIGGHPLYSVVYSGDRYNAATSNGLRRDSTRVQVNIRSRNYNKTGDFYHVERHEYHEAFVPDHIATSTLVCMHGRSGNAVKVVGLDGYPVEISFARSEHRASVFARELLP